MTGLLQLLFFASGFSALVYQLAWVSILKVDFGSTVHSVSTVLTIFMSGLALGSWLAGRLVDRGAPPLRVLAALEGGLGLWAAAFAVSVPALHRLAADVLQGTTLSFGSAAATKLALAMLVLLVPATLMGGTLPVLAKGAIESVDVRGARLASLYGVNTLGAVAGCLAAAFLLVPTVGVRAAMLVAAGVNGLVCLTALRLSRRPASAPAVARRDALPAPPRAVLRRRVALLAFLSGFITLATEVLWTRLAINLLTGNVLVFAAILAGFLGGLSAGSLLVSRVTDTLARPDRTLALWLLGSAAFLAASVFGEAALGRLFHVALSAEYGGWPPARALLVLALLAVIVAVPATAFGAVLPLLFRLGSGALSTLGRDVGRLYALNTLGSIGGSLVSGFVMVETVGVRAGLLLLGAGYASMASLACAGRWRWLSGFATAALLAAAALPPLCQRA